MSEFHPNRTKQVRTRPKLTARRILEAWPILVWLAIGVIAFLVYRSGVVFVRMNGIVDPYQENITPVNDGRLMEIKVKRGEKVPPGSVVAIMDSSKYKLDLESLRRGIIADRTKDIIDQEDKLIKLESELRQLQTENAEDSAIIAALQSLVESATRTVPGRNPLLDQALQNSSDTLRAKTELAKAKGRNALNAAQTSVVTEAINRIKFIRDTFDKEATLIAKNELASDAVTKGSVLRADELQQLVEIQTKIEHCELKTVHGGTVDRIAKEVGELILPGDGILKIVGDPIQIVCFLPQDQADDVFLGKKVYVASSSKKEDIYETEVIGISPRINNVQDSSSPLPNRRVHGRDVLLAYPTKEYPDGAKKDGKFLLLPGQTIIVHLIKPGHGNWLDKLLHSDDNDTKVR